MLDWQLKAREGIRDTLAVYNWCGDNADLDGFLATFTTDGVLEVKGVGTYKGHDAIREGAREGFGQSPETMAIIREAGRVAHHVSSVRIELDDEAQARCWSYFIVHGKHAADHWGRYTDRFNLVDHRWLLSYRRVSIDAAAPSSPMAARATSR